MKRLLPKDWNLILLSIFVLGLSIFVALSPAYFYSDTSSEQEAFSRSGWNTPPIGFAEVLNNQQVSQEVIVERTDYTRKIVNFDASATSSQRQALLDSVGAEVVKDIDSDSVVIKVSEENLSEAEKSLQEDESVASAETDYAVSLLSFPDWGVQRINADDVWDETRGTGVRIAVIDTGVDRNHGEFSGNYIGGYDFVNDDEDPQDDHGHGTAVSGVALAAMNSQGTIGVSPEAGLLSAKVLGSDGVGYVSDVVSGVDWAVDNGAGVVNLSLGTTFDSSSLKSAVDRAASQAVVVAAAGNTSGGSLTYPAAYDSVIAVGATDSEDRLASFSAVGSEIVAPGVSIQAPWLGGGYTTISGTSLSSPHVAGVAAQLISEDISNVRTTLREGTVDLGDEGTDPYFGYGLVDSVLALGESEDDEDSPEVSFISPRDNQRIAPGRVVVNVSASDNKEVLKVDLIVNGRFAYSSATAPYQWLWDLRDVSEQTYTLTARAFDDAGNIAEESITVQIVPAGTQGQTPEDITPGQQQSGESGTGTVDENAPEPAIEKLQQTRNVPAPSKGRGRGVRGASTENSPMWVRMLLFFFGG